MRLALAAFLLLAASCGDSREAPSWRGDAENGRLLLRQFGCGTCHDIPGVAAAKGRVGPPLERIAEQAYLGGVLPNTPENLMDFIRAPQRFEPRSKMPDMGITEPHARDMVAYLLTLR